MGDIGGDRTDQYLPLSLVRGRIKRKWALTETDYRTGGPARYYEVAETGQRIGFITPMTHNFCESCNRVRLTCTGHAVHVPRAGRQRGLPAGAAVRRGRCGTGGRDPGGDRAQAEGS